jgi:hypothetical protein
MVDTMTSLRNVINTASIHDKVHKGRTFTALHTYITSIQDDVLIQVGATPMHFSAIASRTTSADVSFYEAPTFSVAGTAVPSYDKNRSSANSPLATITHTPTVSVAGTKLAGGQINGGEKSTAIGGSAGAKNTEGSEWILAANTDYLLRIVGVSGDGAVNLEWYE